MDTFRAWRLRRPAERALCVLGWPPKADGGHRTIHQIFLALGGWYSARRRLPRDARAARARARRHARRREEARGPPRCPLHRDGCQPRLEYPIGRGGGANLFADVYDERPRLIVEAKATVGGLFPATGQVHRYRYPVNIAADRKLVDRVALLLPGEPCQEDLSCAASMYLADVIWQAGKGFEHRVLT